MSNLARMSKYFVALMLFFSFTAYSEDAALHEEVKSVKAAVLELEKELSNLEQDLVNPATIRADFHFSLAYGEYFDPLALELKIDSETKLQHIYTEREVSALKLGAVQPLGELNLAPGQHKVTVTLLGIDPLGQDIELNVEKVVTKTNKKLVTEIKAVDHDDLQSARLEINHW